MRRQAAPFTTAPAPQDFQQKVGWFPADPNFPAQGQAFYQPGQAPMLISSYPPQPVTFQSFPPGYSQTVPYQTFPGFRPDAVFPEESQPQMMVFRQNPQPVAQTVTYKPQPATAPIARPSGPQIIATQVSPPHVVQQVVPQEPMQLSQPSEQNQKIDLNTQVIFDHLKFPTPGVFSVIRRGNLPGIDYIPI